MNKSSHYFLWLISFLLIIFGAQIIYLKTTTNNYKKIKISFVKLVGLPDLSISNEAHFIRHRSLSDTFSFFSNGPELLEYFPSTFTYSYSNNYKKNPSRIELEN